MKLRKNVVKNIIAVFLAFITFFSVVELSVLNICANSKSDGNTNDFIAVIDSPDASAVKISTAQELAAIKDNVYGSYVLADDIDLSDYGDWTPIGENLSSAFHGKLDGQGHRIIGLQVSQKMTSGTIKSPSYAAGLFGVCDGAQIKNIAFENVSISIATTSGYHYQSSIDDRYSIFAGAIAGYIKNSTAIYNCHASGTVLAKASGEGYSDAIAGGLIGGCDTSVISYSYSLCDVQGYNGNAMQAYDAYAGGLAGRIFREGIIDRSYNSGTVTSQTLDYGNSYAGGLAAGAKDASVEIDNSFNEGSVQGLSGNLFCDPSYAGDLVGIFSGTIDKCYNSGAVTAQAKDPYGISNTQAYAGGICSFSISSAVISNSVALHAAVKADASGTRYQYRISYQAEKTNNVTVDTYSSGSNNDATWVETVDSLKNNAVYTERLGWDFDKIWEMADGKDFPQLKRTDTESDEYQDEYIAQHLAFINGSMYKSICKDYRWAQIYWSEENNFKSNTGEMLYKVTDKLVDLTTLNFGDLFEDNDPFKVIVADYISDQTAAQEMLDLYKIELPYSVESIHKKVKSFIKKYWKDAYGELSDEDLFYLFHYDKRSGEEWINSHFEEHLSEIVYDDSAEKVETLFGLTSAGLDFIISAKDYVNKEAEFLYDLMEYAASLDAYRKADANFKAILTKMYQNIPVQLKDLKYYSQLRNALSSYVNYGNANDVMAAFEMEYYLGKTWKAGEKKGSILSILEKTRDNWLKTVFSEAALSKYNMIRKVIGKTWKIVEYVTKNGELQECREMLRANAFFEEVMFNTLSIIENDFRESNDFAHAELFDMAFKFFKETQIYSMDIVIQYFDTYQTSWAAAIRAASNTFMNSAIHEVQVNKLFLYDTYCHGTTYFLGGKIITVACPTDVHVYNEDGTSAVSIEKNTVIFCEDGMSAYTSDAVKVIAVPADQNYSIKIAAVDNGTMDYSISEFDGMMQNVQTTLYSDIPLQKGDAYTGTIDSMIETSPSSYNLTLNNKKVVDEYKVIDEDSNIPVKGIEIQNEDNKLVVGDTGVLKAVIEPADATVQTVLWSSSNQECISVTEGGEITALLEGTADILAQSIYGGVSAVVTLTVVSADEAGSGSGSSTQDVLVQSISIQQSDVMQTGNKMQLDAKVLPENAANKKLKWSSSDESIAQVDQNGLVTAVDTGKVTITAESTDGSNVSASCIITVSAKNTESPDDTSGGNPTGGGQSGGDATGSGSVDGSSSGGSVSGGNTSGGSSSGGNASGGGSSGGDALGGGSSDGNASGGGSSGENVSDGNTSSGGNNENNGSDKQPDSQVQVELSYYVITFNANGGAKLSRKTMTLHNGDSLGILPKVQRRNYIFKGWYTQKKGGKKVSSSTVLNAGTTLFARWTKVSKPSKVKSLTLKSKKAGQIAMSFRKVTGAKGYEIVYSTNKKFPSSSVKKVAAASAKKTIKKLKSGKKYYVRVRAYKVDSTGKKVYGAYSTVKNIKVK